MAEIEFHEDVVEARVPDPAAGAWTATPLRRRVDPLTGRSARILGGAKLRPEKRPDLTELTAPPPWCPFCAQNLEKSTFPFPAELTDEGRFRRGQAVIVPNILAYATHSAVGLYDTERHFLDLDELTVPLVADILRGLRDHTAAVRRADPAARWSSVSGNYLPPSGSSLVHPHLQSAHDAFGLTVQRTLVERSAAWSGSRSYWSTLVDTERDGERWVGRTGRVSWLTPWAPTGFHEVWGVVEGAADIVDLTDDDTRDLGSGIAAVLRTYRDWNLTSFNLALPGGGPDGAASRYELVVRLVSRSNAEPMYRSDVTYFERLYDEALLDMTPEEVAAGVRASLAG